MWCQVTRKCGNYDHGLEELVLETFQRSRRIGPVIDQSSFPEPETATHPTFDIGLRTTELPFDVIDDQVALIREAFAPSWQVF